MIRRLLPVAPIVASVWLSGCRTTDDRPSGGMDVPVLRADALPLALELRTTEGGLMRGLAPGDSLPRLLVRRNPRNEATARLCGVLATGSAAPVSLPWVAPVDSAAPRLAQRLLTTGDVHGVRFVVPGPTARYVFAGITRDGSQVVSLQWPVAADPARPIPVGAPDSVVEAAIVPSVFRLDSMVHALHFDTPPDKAWPKQPVDGPLADARAVPDVRLLPVHVAALSVACPDVTLALPMLARADHTVKIPVNAGDRVTAQAGVANGTVRISFDEAPPTAEPPAREAVTRAAIEATAAGDVTLRVRLQVLPRVQVSRQNVLVRLQRTRTGR
jgi:hypothetical protein